MAIELSEERVGTVQQAIRGAVKEDGMSEGDSLSPEVQQRRDDVLLSVSLLPPLPASVNEIIKLAEDPDTQANDFEAPFHKDPALAARLIKLVNSSFFAIPTKITSIPRAVALLGFKSLKSLALASAASEHLRVDMKDYGYRDGGLLEHSLLTAAISRHIGLSFCKIEPEKAEELFVAGLLHDIGKIVLAPFVHTYEDQCKIFKQANPKAGIVALEKAVLGVDHTEVGVMISDQWRLGSAMSQIIGYHHTPSPKVKENPYASIVMMADLLSTRKGLGIDKEYPWLRPTPTNLVSELRMGAKHLNSLKTDVRGMVEDVKDLVCQLN